MSPGGSRLSRLARVLFIAAATGLGLWVALGVTLTLVIGRAQPTVALKVWPHGTTSNAALAERLVQTSDRQAGRGAAQEALRREPVNVVAARSLGLLASIDGDARRASRLFSYSETLSRRDVPTQLWLIEESVGRGDIIGALRHYDRAMRTSLQSRDLLIPILARASADPAIAEPLSRLVASRPSWTPALVEAMISSQSTPPAALALILRRLTISPDDEYSWLLSGGLNRLVAAGEFETAYAIYYEARRGVGARTELLRNGDFSVQHPIPPFDWWLRDEPELAGLIEHREGTPTPALSIVADQGRVGDIARQFLMLTADAYQLTATVGEVSADERARPIISIACVGGSELARSRFPAATTTPARLTLRFSVPSTGCEAQWIAIESGPSGEQPEDLRPWITSVSLARL
jgi:hypothetical protein